MAGVDILAPAFSGANAAFLGDQYARWAVNPPPSIPASPTCSPPWTTRPAPSSPMPPAPPGRRTVRRRGRAGLPARRTSGSAPAARGNRCARRAGARRHHRLPARADADPHLSRARPSGSEARPARPADAGPHPELDPRSYGFTEADLDRPIFIDNVLGRETATLREIIAHAARHLLRPDRRRVHAHPGPGPEVLDPAPGRRRALAAPRSMPTASAASCGS